MGGTVKEEKILKQEIKFKTNPQMVWQGKKKIKRKKKKEKNNPFTNTKKCISQPIQMRLNDGKR